MRYIYTMEYYSVIKNNEIMSYAATWMDLEIIVLDEVRQRKTNMKYHLFLVLTLQPLFIYLFLIGG